jgi:hypothetical protein
MVYRYVAVLGICRVLILYAEEQERRKVAQERKGELLCFAFGCAGCLSSGIRFPFAICYINSSSFWLSVLVYGGRNES